MFDEPPDQPPEQSAQSAQDWAWMARIKLGDELAFQSLIEAHQQRVIGVVAKMLGNLTDAEDIAQQVFVRIWKSAHRYEPTAKFTTWMYKITRNLVFNELRRRKRHPTQSIDVLNDFDQPMQVADEQAKGADNLLLDAEVQEAIQQAIDSLPETQRMAIILRRYDEVPYEEIAKILDLSVPAVKSVLFRARTELREQLKRYLDA